MSRIIFSSPVTVVRMPPFNEQRPGDLVELPCRAEDLPAATAAWERYGRIVVDDSGRLVSPDERPDLYVEGDE